MPETEPVTDAHDIKDLLDALKPRLTPEGGWELVVDKTKYSLDVPIDREKEGEVTIIINPHDSLLLRWSEKYGTTGARKMWRILRPTMGRLLGEEPPAAKVRITTTGTPGAGAIRSAWYVQEEKDAK